MINFTEIASWIGRASINTELVDQVAKATFLLLVAWAISFLLRRTSASIRHQVWTAALLAVLVLPLLSVALPTWRVPVFSAQTAMPNGVPIVAGADIAPTQTPQHVPIALGEEANEGTLTPSAGQVEAGEVDVSKVLPLVWALGALLFLARVLVSSLAAWKVVHDSAPVQNADLLAEAKLLCRELGIRSEVTLVENPRITMPMAWGLFRQTVLLPATAHAWTQDRRRVVLLHELAHLKRWDCQTLLLARVVTALHWFNPLAWVAVRRLQAEREHACDDLVLTAGTPGSDYAQHLLDIARAMQSSLSPGWAMVAMARPSELEGRLLAILDPHLNRAQTTRFARLGGLLAIVFLVLPLASLQPRANAEEEPSAQKPALAESAKSSSKARLVEAFSLALRDEDAEVRAQAAHSLGSFEDAAAVPLLEESVRSDTSEHVREQAAWALGMIEDPAALPALQAAMSDTSTNVRQQAAWALGMIESAAAVPQLRTALSDDDASVRQQAAWALGMIESEAAVEVLTSTLKADTSPEVRKQVAWALGMIGDEAALDALLNAMSEDNVEVRKQALWAVGQISG